MKTRLHKQLFETAAIRSMSTAGRAFSFLLAVRILNPSDYGLYSLAQTSVLVGTLVGTLNLQAYLIRALPGLAEPEQRGIFSKLMSGVVLANAGVAALVAVLIRAYFPQVSSGAAIVLGALYLFEILAICAENFFLGCQQIGRANALVFLRTAVLAVLLLIVWRDGVHRFGVVLAVWAVADVTALLVFAPRFIGWLRISVKATRDAALWGDAMRYSLPLFAASLAFYLIKSTDRYVIVDVLGLPAVALYDVAYKAVNSFYGLTVLAVNTVMVPAVMAAENAGDAGSRDRQIGKATKYSAYALMCCVAGALAAPGWVWVRATGHAEYAHAGSIAALLALAMLFSIAGVPAHLLLLAKRKTAVIAYADVTGLIANVVLNVLLVPVMNLQGAALSAIASFALAALIKHIYVRRADLLAVETLFDWAEERRLLARAIGREVSS